MFSALHRRQPMWTPEQIKVKRKEVWDRIVQLPKFESSPDISQEQEELLEKRRQEELSIRMQKAVYKWRPVNYSSTHDCLKYCLSRLAHDYSAIYKVLNEIRKRDPDFHLYSAMDFGSGVGANFWACREHWNNIKEYHMVDCSNEMNDTALLIMKVYMHYHMV